MKNRTLIIIVISQIFITMLFLLLTIGNEILDIPHYVFNDTPTSYSQRIGEIIIELSIFLVVMTTQSMLLRKLFKHIKLLEGFIPICAKCKKIRNKEDKWVQMEDYISKHSLAKFSHGLCDDCARQLYPEYYNKKR
jgi:hypothetical protein